MNRALVILLLSAIAISATAQQRMPDPAEVARELTRIERERKALFDPANPDTAVQANPFPAIPAPAASGIDIAALAQRYAQKAQASRRDEVMLFASFTMPPAALQRLVAAAGKIGAPVIFRGFKNNSLKDTSAAVQALGQRDGALLINPNAFTKYQVKSVPMLVLVKADGLDQVDAEGCALPDVFVSVAGDVSIDFALDAIAQRSPEFAPIATRILRQYRGGP